MPPRVSLHLLKPLADADPIPDARAFAASLARAGAARGQVSLILTGSEELHRLNRDFRGKDRPTDVIAFDYRETGGREPETVHIGAGDSRSLIWGDVYVSADAAEAQARERGIGAAEEATRLFLHGCLHLLGYRHDTPADHRRMESAQEAMLASLLS
jgi:probable rRNA maturation factor